MASVTKSVSGTTSTFVVTDQESNAATLTVSAGAVTGPTVTFASGAMQRDGVQMIFNLLNQLQTGLIPGNGAQGLTN